MDNLPGFVRSPLSQSYRDDDMTVRVEIYRHDGVDGWALVVIDEEDRAIIWQDVFQSDAAAMAQFTEAVEILGLTDLMTPDPKEAATEH